MKQETLSLIDAQALEILAWEDQITRDETQQSTVLILSQITGYILGADDLKIINYPQGRDSIQAHPIYLRSVGGKAVFSDEGILNLSYIFEGANDFHAIYSKIANLIINTLSPLGLAIEVKEITGSYCAGKYDLSIDDKKIGGIAQKRIKNRYCVSAYLAINGDQDNRSNRIKSFYNVMGKDPIKIESMTTLQDALKRTLSLDEIVSLFQSKASHYDLQNNKLSTLSIARIEQNQKKLFDKT